MAAEQGWFVLNAREAPWRTHETFGASCRFEPEPGAFEQLGINLRLLRPGQPNCLYPRENLQEGYLVLSGECRLLVEGEERPLRAWDYAHLPPDTDHVLVGAGDGPALVLMVGARSPDEELFYPRAEVAVRHGVSIIGASNLARSLAADASALFARNLYNFLSAFWDKEQARPVLPDDDEIVKAIRLTQGGRIVNERLSAA